MRQKNTNMFNYYKDAVVLSQILSQICTSVWLGIAQTYIHRDNQLENFQE